MFQNGPNLLRLYKFKFVQRYIVFFFFFFNVFSPSWQTELMSNCLFYFIYVIEKVYIAKKFYHL